MSWNWEHKDWPNWIFHKEKIEKFEKEFLLRAGHLGALWEYLNNKDKEQIKISILTNEALKTSEIEGKIFDRDSVRSSIKKHFGLHVQHRTKPGEYGIAKMMVLCYESYTNILTEEMLFTWHKLICNGRDDIENIGGYRTHTEAMQIVSGQIDNPHIHFEAPTSKQVKKEMTQFIKWLQTSCLGPLAKSAIAHMYFTSIHPFEDGNGRIGRAICEHILSHELQKPSLIMLSTEVEKEKKQYYKMLEENSTSLEIDEWVIWFAKLLLNAQEHSIRLLEHLLQKTKLMTRFQGQLNERQEKGIIRIFDAGPDGFLGGLSAKNYSSITKAPPATVTRDLADLVKKGVFIRTGERKSTRYFLNI